MVFPECSRKLCLKESAITLCRNFMLFSLSMIRPPSNRNTDKSLVAAFVLALVFATPFTSLWSRSELPWHLPYLLWLSAILLLVLSQRRRKKDPGKNERT